MKPITFVKHYKKYYPNGYESLEEEFEKRIKRDAYNEKRYAKVNK